MFFCLRKTIAVAMVVGLATLSCKSVSTPVDPEILNVDQPFGLRWELTETQLASLLHPEDEVCWKMLNSKQTDLRSNESCKALNSCRSVPVRRIFFSKASVPVSLQDGEISARLDDDFQLISYEFSYLHRVIPEQDPVQNQRKRERKAAELQKALKLRYGEPSREGYFAIANSEEFFSDQNNKQPCKVWVVSEIGILLCKQRFVLIDGVEMSLSFVDLNKSNDGAKVKAFAEGEMAQTSAGGETATDKNTGLLPHLTFDERMACWPQSDEFNACRASDLEPLEKAWTLKPDDSTTFRALLAEKSGDDLALFAIDYLENMELDISQRDKDKRVMFLLREAASQKSPIAMNEIGASALYCYQHVEQDLKLASLWLERAASLGDVMAMRSLSWMHLSGMIDSEQSKAEAKKHLTACSKAGSQKCSYDLEVWSESN